MPFSPGSTGDESDAIGFAGQRKFDEPLIVAADLLDCLPVAFWTQHGQVKVRAYVAWHPVPIPALRMDDRHSLRIALVAVEHEPDIPNSLLFLKTVFDKRVRSGPPPVLHITQIPVDAAAQRFGVPG